MIIKIHHLKLKKSKIYWLDKQIKLVKPELIVTIGNSALRSLKLFFPESKQLNNYKLKNDIGSVIQDTKPWIYPLYHTSLRARIRRNAELQKKDWLKINTILEDLLNTFCG